MSDFDFAERLYMRTMGLVLRGSWRAAKHVSGEMARAQANRSARTGLLVPGDPSPVGGGVAGYYDYRGTAQPGELRFARDPVLPIGKLWDLPARRPRPSHSVWLGANDLRQHLAVIGPGRSGKTAGFIVPWAVAGLRAGMSVIAVDVIGSLGRQILAHGQATAAPSTSAPRRRIAAWDYRNPQISWNWISELDSERMVEAATEALLGRERPNDPQPYFHQRDSRLLKGLLLAVQRRPANLTATELLRIIADRDELEQVVIASADPRAEAFVREVLYLDPGDYVKAVSGVVNALTPLASPAVDKVTARDQLRLDDALTHPGLLLCGAPMGDGKLAIATSSLLLSLLKQRLFERIAAPPPVRTLLIVDEAARLADRLAFEQLLSVAAQAGATVCLALQDLAQLTRHEDRSAVTTNCGAMFCLPGVSKTTASALRDRLGERPEESVSFDQNFGLGGGRRVGQQYAMVPVLRERELMSPPLAGWPAVAHVRSMSDKPFLVDLTRADL